MNAYIYVFVYSYYVNLFIFGGGSERKAFVNRILLNMFSFYSGRDHPIYRDFPTNIVVVPCHMKGNLRLVSDDPIGTPPDYLGEEHEMAGFRDEFAKHKIVSLTGNKKRLCLICKITRRRTSGGCRVSARHKCGLCDVYLCKGERGCYLHYHQILYQNGGSTNNPERLIADAFGISYENI